MKPALIDSNALLPKTLEAIQKLAQLPLLDSFTFVGGSALACYLQHRQSEDIDLFTWEKQLEKEAILRNFRAVFAEINLISDTEIQQDWVVDGVKVTLFANGWQALLSFQKLEVGLGYINIATFPLLCAMKANTLFLRAKFRDYYDLYAISKTGMSAKKLYQVAFSFLPNLNQRLFQMALIYTDDIADDDIGYLQPKYKMNKAKVSKYFEKQVSAWMQEK